MPRWSVRNSPGRPERRSSTSSPTERHTRVGAWRSVRATGTTTGGQRRGAATPARSPKPRPGSTRSGSGSGIGSRSCRGTGRSGRKPTSATLSLGAISVPVYPTSAAPQVGYVARAFGRAESASSRTPSSWGACSNNAISCPHSSTSWSSTNGCRTTIRCCSRSKSSERSARRRSNAIRTWSTGRASRSRPTTSRRSSTRAAQPVRPRGRCSRTPTSWRRCGRSPTLVPLSPDDRFLSFLPLSHITERSVSHFGLIASGGETWFARSISTVAEDLPDCRPTIFFAVPRVWEKIREGVESRVARLDGVRGRAARTLLVARASHARELEHAGSTCRSSRSWPGSRSTGPSARSSAPSSASTGPASRVRRRADPSRTSSVGSTASACELAEGYGQTEVALATTMNPPGAIAQSGTVGPPLPGVSIRIADDGEILVRGDNVCAGYWHNEDATHALIDDDGWLHSGDLGAFDDHGYLRITGRKKDLIITAHGKNISPQNIETDLAVAPADRPGRRGRRRPPLPHRASRARRDRGRELGTGPQQGRRRARSARAGSGPAARGRPRGRRDERPALARRAHPHVARAPALADRRIRRADADAEGQAAPRSTSTTPTSSPRCTPNRWESPCNSTMGPEQEGRPA